MAGHFSGTGRERKRQAALHAAGGGGCDQGYAAAGKERIALLASPATRRDTGVRKLPNRLVGRKIALSEVAILIE
jgi:hypothetical protein